MALHETLCRVLLFSSLAFDTPNEVTVEFTTPAFVGPDSVLFCFLNTQPPFLLDRSTTNVASLTKGGSQFNLLETQVQGISGPDAAQNSAPGWSLRKVEVGVVPDILGTDPYYAHSYEWRRYDDFREDGSGNSLDGLFVPDGSAARAAGAQHGNCVLVTTPFEANQRYEITLAVTNPPPGIQLGDLRLWAAPLTLSNAEYGQMAFTLRGPRHGSVCQMQQLAAGVPGTPPRLFDACTVARGSALPLPDDPQPQDCLDALATNLAGNPSLSTAFPYTQRPIADVTVGDYAQLQCSQGEAVSPRNGGECVSCEPPGQVDPQGASCDCPADHSSFLVGLKACGGQLVPGNPNVTSSEALARSLCSAYTTYLDMLHGGDLSDRLVNAAFLGSFEQQARLLLDGAEVFAANRTARSDLAFDDRQPDSPSRSGGIKPNCNLCHGNGNFTSFDKKTEGRVFDERYGAANTLRTVGAAIVGAGYSCPALFNTTDAAQSVYGPYEDRMCEDLDNAKEL